MNNRLRTLLFSALALLHCSCAKKPIVGWWRANDSTIFNFRADGTFVGRDYVGVPIWGNWVDLGDNKFGFQSLAHTQGYAPQYAVVTSQDKMQYAGSAGVVFFYTERISETDGKKELDPVISAMPVTNPPSNP